MIISNPPTAFYIALGIIVTAIAQKLQILETPLGDWGYIIMGAVLVFLAMLPVGKAVNRDFEYEEKNR